jgi:hypothetical protein
VFDFTHDFYGTGKRPASEAEQLGVDIWRLRMTHCVLLNKNYRARDDEDYALFLANLRNHNKILPAHIKKLQSRQLKTGLNSSAPSQTIPIDAVWAFFKNTDAVAVNMHMAHHAAAARIRKVFRFTAEIRQTATGDPIQKVNDPALSSFLVGEGSNELDMGKDPMSHLDLYYGAKVMFHVGNKGNSGGVANGTQGFFIETVPPLKDLLREQSETARLPNGDQRGVHSLKRLPQYLLVFVPGATVQYDGLPVGVVPIPLKIRRLRLPGYGSQKMHVSQFAVRHGFAYVKKFLLIFSQISGTFFAALQSPWPSLILRCTDGV